MVPAGTLASTISPGSGKEVAFSKGTTILASSSGSTLAGRGQDNSGPVQIACDASKLSRVWASCQRNSAEIGALSSNKLHVALRFEFGSVMRICRIITLLLVLFWSSVVCIWSPEQVSSNHSSVRYYVPNISQILNIYYRIGSYDEYVCELSFFQSAKFVPDTQDFSAYARG